MSERLPIAPAVASPESFLDAFDRFVRAVRRARGVGARDDAGLTLSQYGLVEALLERDPARVRELANRAGITPPTATSILGTLERRGVVVRAQAPADRRGVEVSLTERGRELLARRHAWLRDRQRELFLGLSEAERALAPELLDRFAELVDEMAAGPEA